MATFTKAQMDATKSSGVFDGTYWIEQPGMGSYPYAKQIGPDQWEIPDQILSSNMDSGGMFDWGDMVGPGLLLGLPAAGMLGAFGGATGAGVSAGSGAGGAFDMGGLGAAESMGLGAGYTSPAVGAAGGACQVVCRDAPAGLAGAVGVAGVHRRCA